MTHRFLATILTLALGVTLSPGPGRAQTLEPPGPAFVTPAPGPLDSGRAAVQAVIERHLGRPYVWGSSGLKSFDCSGFVWRVMQENGVLIKRTTARKFYLTLPKVPEDQRWAFGNVVFFSNLKHCGIVRTPETFYHAAVSTGTHVSRFTPFWRRRLSGVRAMPGLAPPGATPAGPRAVPGPPADFSERTARPR